MKWWFDIGEECSPIDIKVPTGRSQYYEEMIDKYRGITLDTEKGQESLVSLISEIQKEDMNPLNKLILIDLFMNLISLPSQNVQ